MKKNGAALEPFSQRHPLPPFSRSPISNHPTPPPGFTTRAATAAVLVLAFPRPVPPIYCFTRAQRTSPSARSVLRTTASPSQAWWAAGRCRSLLNPIYFLVIMLDVGYT